MKVVKSTLSNSFNVVPDAFGEIRERNGRKYSYEPIPICRVPVGHNRTEAQAEKLAMWLCQCINAGLAFDGLPLEIQEGTFGNMH